MEYTALYRKWRPNTFDEVVGQDHIVRILKNQIISGRISHAYLFCGSRGTGKTSTAKIFAKAINCIDNKDGNPCGECDVCKVMDSENNMDVLEIDAASNNGVNDIREISDKVKYPPSAGRYRVYIIDEVHMLSTSAFNAFLKTLEEPPDHILFILATTEPHKLPSTILSRCQRYDFRRMTLGVLINRLRTIIDQIGIEAEDEALETIARWSEGGMRDSISLLDQCISFCGSSITQGDVLDILGTAGKEFLFEVANNIMEGDLPSLLLQINNLVEEGKDIAVFLKDIIHHLRNLLIVKICDDPTDLMDVSQSSLDQYRKQASRIDQSRLVRSIESLSQLDAEIKWDAEPRIMLEMAMVKICMPQGGKSLEDLMDRISVLEDKVSKGVSIVGESIPTPQEKAIEGNHRDNDDIKNNNVNSGLMGKEDSSEMNYPREKAAEPKIVEEKSKPVEVASKDIDINKAWADVLKIIKKDRMAIFTLLRETKLQVGGKNKNIANLIFPTQQGFYVAAIEKDENSQYIEELIYKTMGQSYKLKCYTEDSMPSSLFQEETSNIQEEKEEYVEEVQDDIIQEAINLFGSEYVEVIED
ncbi:MAG TPA: DNA polymerase III subunit gamma/tau [Clostridia bacterium]|nr:DNA polymerase III subunit gamma/tau [Clostridia bacterium]